MSINLVYVFCIRVQELQNLHIDAPCGNSDDPCYCRIIKTQVTVVILGSRLLQWFGQATVGSKWVSRLSSCSPGYPVVLPSAAPSHPFADTHTPYFSNTP